MEPIVNPWLIYFLGVVENLNNGVAIIWIGCGLVILGLGLWGALEDEIETASKKMRKFFIIGIICLSVSIVFPSKNTIIGMIIAKNVTPTNVEKAIKSGKNLKDELKKDVIDIIQSVTKEEKKTK